MQERFAVILNQGSANLSPELCRSGRSGSSVLTLNLAHVFPPDAPNDEQLFSPKSHLVAHRSSMLVALTLVDVDWLPYT